MRATWRTERVVASKTVVIRLEAFNGRRRVALAVAIGLALVAFGVTRIINARNTRADKAVTCRELGNLYDMAAIGPTKVSDDWQDDSLVSAELVAEHGDEVGVKANPSQMMFAVMDNHPSTIRWFARDVGCPAGAFPDPPVLSFDSATSEAARATSDVNRAMPLDALDATFAPPTIRKPRISNAPIRGMKIVIERMGKPAMRQRPCPSITKATKTTAEIRTTKA